MLMLAVAAGESGANPELSRNGVLVHICAQESVRGPVDSAPGRPARVLAVRASWSGPVDRDAVRARVLPPALCQAHCRARESPT